MEIRRNLCFKFSFGDCKSTHVYHTALELLYHLLLGPGGKQKL